MAPSPMWETSSPPIEMCFMAMWLRSGARSETLEPVSARSMLVLCRHCSALPWEMVVVSARAVSAQSSECLAYSSTSLEETSVDPVVSWQMVHPAETRRTDYELR
jgi:hypothetical protein